MKKKVKAAAVTASTSIFLIILLLYLAGATFDFSQKINDLAYQSPSVINPEITVIGIDEYTLSTYGAYDTWVREKTAELIEYLCADEAEKPAVIAIDIGFYGHKDTETDERLVAAVQKAGNVVLVSSVAFSESIVEFSDGSFSKDVSAKLVEEPFEELKNACAGVGHSNIVLDGDGVARHALSAINYNGKAVDSFDEVIYQVYTGNPSEYRNQSFYIGYSGLPGEYFGGAETGTSLVNVLDGKIPQGYFSGSIVYFGAYATGMQDAYHTSISSERMNGVEIHANILNHMLTGKAFSEAAKPVAVIILVVISGLALAFLAASVKLPYVLDVAVGLLYFIVVRISYSAGYLLPVFEPLLLVVLLCITTVFIKYYGASLEKKRLVVSYGKYLSPEVAATISEDGENEIKLGGVKRDIAVLFVDIRGFTTLSEKLSPDKVVQMLNSYLKLTTSAIFNNKGTVDKFIGDATMGIFNAPLESADYTYNAVMAGLEMVKRADEVNKELPDELKNKVGFGVGINCGEAIIGNIGADFRMEYTAIGDTVNTASRLEGQAPKGTVIISEAVYERVKDRIICEDRGAVKLKGKENPVKIYSVIEEIKKESGN